jgi:hypothetical protein
MIELFEKPIKFSEAKVIGSGINPDEYHRENVMRGMPGYVLTRSSLLLFNSCPKKWINGWNPRDSDGTEWGSLIDCLVLTPERFADTYIVEPQFYPAPEDCTAVKQKKCKAGDALPWNNQTKYCQEWKAAQYPRIVLSAKEYAEAQTAVEILFKDERIANLLVGSQKQVWVEGIYNDPATKMAVKVKTLIDIVPNGIHSNDLADFKTTRSAHKSSWPKAVSLYGYDVQAALCLDLFNAATGEHRNTFLHAMQENTPPFQTARRLLSQEFVNFGRMKLKGALERYCQCLKHNLWPDWDELSPFNGWSIVEPDSWMIKNIESPESFEPTEDNQEQPEEELSGAFN